MSIGIIDLSFVPPKLRGKLPSFGEQIRRWLSPSLPEISLEIVDVTGGAEVPGVADFDGFLISGSEKGVYDEVIWMDPLRALLGDIRDHNKPVFGICFGHQIMADHFGGKAELAAVGEARGARQFDIGSEPREAYVWHKDQVTKVPPGARVTASSAYCPVGALAYDFPAMSTQFHPEYSQDFLRNFVDQGRGEVLDDAESDAFIAAIAQSNVAEDLMAREAADFFRRHLLNN